MNQVELKYRDPERVRRIWKALRSAARVAAEARGIKAVASDWDKAHSTVSRKLDELERNKLDLDEVLDLFAEDGAGVMIKALCEALGYDEPPRKRALTAQEKLDRYDAVLDANPELAQVIRRKAGVLT